MALVSLAELFGPAVREHLKTCNRITAHFRPISRKLRGCSLVVKPQSSKLMIRVRFPSSPPFHWSQALTEREFARLRGENATDSPVHPPSHSTQYRIQARNGRDPGEIG